MELPSILALSLFVLVYAASATRWFHRAVAPVVATLIVMALWGAPTAWKQLIPDVLLVTAGLMMLAGYARRSGAASWLALLAAKAAYGRPSRILLLLGVLTGVAGAVLGPLATVGLVLPVALLLAVELDVPPLPFVVVLTWTSLLGAATTVTALPGNLWLATSLGLDAWTWVAAMAPYTAAAFVVTLVVGSLVFRKQLRVTNERRARVLEYDEAQSLEDRPLAAKTLVVTALVAAGFAAAPWLGWSPSLIAMGGATLLWLWDDARTTDRLFAGVDGGALLFWAGLMVVVGMAATTGLAERVVQPWPPLALVASWLASLALDQGAVAGLFAPILKAWSTQGLTGVWPLVVLGTTFGAGTSVLGTVAGAALNLGQSSRRVAWTTFALYGLLFSALNAVTALLLWMALR